MNMQTVFNNCKARCLTVSQTFDGCDILGRATHVSKEINLKNYIRIFFPATFFLSDSHSIVFDSL